MQNNTTSLSDLTGQLNDLAGLINFRIGAWQDFGYEVPPGPGCQTIPPLGQRSAAAITAGHEAVKDIDQLISQLHQIRAGLVGELRRDSDLRAARVDAMLASIDVAAGIDPLAIPPNRIADKHDPADCRDGDHYGQCSGATAQEPPEGVPWTGVRLHLSGCTCQPVAGSHRSGCAWSAR